MISITIAQVIGCSQRPDERTEKFFSSLDRLGILKDEDRRTPE
jgi:hypothetical protein